MNAIEKYEELKATAEAARKKFYAAGEAIDAAREAWRIAEAEKLSAESALNAWCNRIESAARTVESLPLNAPAAEKYKPPGKYKMTRRERKSPDEHARNIVKFLPQDGSVARSQEIGLASGLGKRSPMVSKYLKRAVEMGFIECVARGQYRTSSPATNACANHDRPRGFIRKGKNRARSLTEAAHDCLDLLSASNGRVHTSDIAGALQISAQAAYARLHHLAGNGFAFAHGGGFYEITKRGIAALSLPVRSTPVPPQKFLRAV